MVLASALYSSGGSLPGDTLRTSSIVSCNNGDNTILNNITGSGIVRFIHIMPTNNSGAFNMTLRVTVDGAAQRDLTLPDLPLSFPLGHIVIPVPITFNSSITIKLNHSGSSGWVKAYVCYSIA